MGDGRGTTFELHTDSWHPLAAAGAADGLSGLGAREALRDMQEDKDPMFGICRQKLRRVRLAWSYPRPARRRLKSHVARGGGLFSLSNH